MKAKSTNIRWQLFFYMSIFVLVMLVVLWLFQTVFLIDFYKAIKTWQIKGTANLIVKNIDNENLSELLTGISQSDNGVTVALFSEEGSVIFMPAVRAEPFGVARLAPRIQINPFQTATPVPGIKQLIDEARRKGDISVFEKNHSLTLSEPPVVRLEAFVGGDAVIRAGRAENIMHMAKAVSKSGENVYILISTLITPVDATVMTLRYQLMFISVILVIFAVILSLYMSRKFAKPIVEINQMAKQLTIGNYDITFNTSGYREIDELNDTLNSAAYELSRVDNLRRELIANVSHDLRTPLTMITGFAEMIKDLPGENKPENAQVIIDESNRLTRLVSDLLDISRLESGGSRPNAKVFNLSDTIRETADRIEAIGLSGERRILFQAAENVRINAVESQIIQVIYNLLANAVNYSDGDVTIKQRVINKRVRIEVCDTGNGISQCDLPYIWERYYKASSLHKRANIGTGLGLSIVKGVVESHGGACGVESAEGVGSVFWFELETYLD